MGNVKVHWHVVPVRSCWTTTTLSTSCCCLHGGHRLLEIIPMPGSSPTLLLAPTSRPSPLNSLPSAGQSHPPADIETGRRCWLGGGRVGRLAAGGGRPTTDDGFKPRRPLWEAGGACGASCARSWWCRSRDGKWDLDVLLLPSFPTHPCLPSDLGWATHRSHKGCEGLCSTFGAAADCSSWSTGRAWNTW